MSAAMKWLESEEVITAIRDWFGIGPDYTITHVGFRSQLPLAVLLAAAAGAVLLTAWLYWREKMLSRWLRVFLTFLRAAVYLAVLLILACPFVSMEKQITIRRNLLVLLDRSKSMAIEDKRATPEALADAALALGKSGYALPAEHESLVRARFERSGCRLGCCDETTERSVARRHCRHRGRPPHRTRTARTSRGGRQSGRRRAAERGTLSGIFRCAKRHQR
jgi:hypothetical protein